MRKRHIKIRGLMLATVVSAAVAALATLPETAASGTAGPCPGGPLVVNAYGTYRNSADVGNDGHVWALDAARESIQIWQFGTNTYCFKRPAIGTNSPSASAERASTCAQRGSSSNRRGMGSELVRRAGSIMARA